MNSFPKNSAHSRVWVCLLLFLWVVFGAKVGETAGEEKVFLSKAQAALTQGNIPNAQTFFTKAKALDPESPEVVNFGKKLQETVQALVQKHMQEGDSYAGAKNFPLALEA